MFEEYWKKLWEVLEDFIKNGTACKYCNKEEKFCVK